MGFLDDVGDAFKGIAEEGVHVYQGINPIYSPGVQQIGSGLGHGLGATGDGIANFGTAAGAATGKFMDTITNPVFMLIAAGITAVVLLK